MKVVFDHVEGFGKTDKIDFIYSNPKGTPTTTNYLDYLDEGWIEWGGDWYNLRSTRIDVSSFTPSKTTKRLSKKIQYKSSYLSFYQYITLHPIYKSYLKQKGYARDIDLEQFIGYQLLLYKYSGKVIGATVFKVYEQGDKKDMVSYQFIWDYQEPRLSLGKVAQYFEVEYAKEIGCKYVYLLGGYEESSIYKSSFKGMQWFTGEGWSTDIETYKRLCERDSKIILDDTNI